MQRTAAFFDLDKTLLAGDSGVLWMKDRFRRKEIGRRDIAKTMWWSLLYKAAILNMDALVDKLVAEQAGASEAEVRARSNEWFSRDVEPRLSRIGKQRVAHHRARGDMLVMITGATQYVAEPAAASLGIDHVLCTRIGQTAGAFNGAVDARCFGQHKVTLAEEFARTHQVDLEASIFYSDSFNDMPMLSRVGMPVAVNPDLRLRWHAKKTGWRREFWPA